MKKNRIYGIKESKSVAVRWMGAYGFASSVLEVAEWEVNPNRQVSCEIMQINSKSGIEDASVGLLVDQSKTTLVRAYVGDSSTVIDGYRLIATKDNRYVTTWGQAGGLQRMSARCGCWGYTEGTIENPVYSAIVVKNSKPGTMRFASELSELIDLPLKTLLKCHIEAACK